VDGVDGGVAVDPEGVVCGAAQAAEDAAADGAGEAGVAGVAQGGEELVAVAFDEGDIPFDADSEAGVGVAADGEV